MGQHFNIGKLVATFGVNGQMILLHALGQKTDLKGLVVLLLEIKKGDLVPYFVQQTKCKNDTEVYITIEDITTKEQAKQLVNKQVWLKEADFKKYIAPESNLSLLGYTIYDGEKKLSNIEEVIEQPHQLLAKIFFEGKEMLIPINDAFILQVDTKNKQLILALPDGLLDIFE